MLIAPSFALRREQVPQQRDRIASCNPSLSAAFPRRVSARGEPQTRPGLSPKPA